MKSKKLRKNATALGLGIVLVHNGVEIDKEGFDLIQKNLSDEFDGDLKKALSKIEEQYNNTLEELGVKVK